MSAVVDALRKVTGRQSDVADRVEGLRTAAEAARGRVDAALVDDTLAVVERAGARLRLSDEHTVVALGGATGSGKSSLFNALCDLDLAAVGVKRPTTSWALACSWGPEGAGELLDWVGIPKRHQIDRMGMLDESKQERDLRGLVLLDLPDHDSTEVAHHLEVERLVTMADLLVWVLDPQKYADAAIHDRFLRPLASHCDSMLVVLNHIDEIPPGETAACLSDLRRLLALDGLSDIPVLGTSATHGDGLDELRAALVTRVAKKAQSRERLSADVRGAADRLAEQTGTGRPEALSDKVAPDLLEAAVQAAGVPVIVDAVERATVLRARRATGWPGTAWLGRLRRDPLRRLRLSNTDAGGEPVVDLAQRSALSARMSQPESVQRARLDSAVRAMSDEATAGMARPWELAIRTASTSRVGDLTRGLSAAVSSTDLGTAKDPWWWGAARVLQWLLFAVAVVGALWLVGFAGAAFLQLSMPDPMAVGPVPLPTLLLVGAVVCGVIVAYGCRMLAQVSARRRARLADDRLRAAIARVTEEIVAGPMQAEIDAYVRCRQGLEAALRR